MDAYWPGTYVSACRCLEELEARGRGVYPIPDRSSSTEGRRTNRLADAAIPKTTCWKPVCGGGGGGGGEGGGEAYDLITAV